MTSDTNLDSAVIVTFGPVLGDTGQGNDETLPLKLDIMERAMYLSNFSGSDMEALSDVEILTEIDYGTLLLTSTPTRYSEVNEPGPSQELPTLEWARVCIWPQ